MTWHHKLITIFIGLGVTPIAAHAEMAEEVLQHATDSASTHLFTVNPAVLAPKGLQGGVLLMRQTRKSDVAFWLHLLAAPLIVRPIFSALGVLEGTAEAWQAIAVVALYVEIALVSLAIDRRALMVSALIYELYTFSALLSQYGGVSLSFAVTGVAIGSALLLLSAFWHRSRAFVLGRLSPAVQGRLAPSR